MTIKLEKALYENSNKQFNAHVEAQIYIKLTEAS